MLAHVTAIHFEVHAQTFSLDIVTMRACFYQNTAEAEGKMHLYSQICQNKTHFLQAQLTQMAIYNR